MGRTRGYITFIFLNTALLVRIPYAKFIIVTIFSVFFLLFAISFLHFIQFDLFGDNNILTSDP